MVDNRSAGFFGIGGSFNFKSGDISGTAAKTSDDRQSNGTDYFDTRRDGEAMEGQMNNSPYVDRSAQLNATLNSLAMMNVANLIKKANQKSKKRTKIPRKNRIWTKSPYGKITVMKMRIFFTLTSF